MKKHKSLLLSRQVALTLFAVFSLFNVQAETVPYTSTAIEDAIKINVSSGTASSFQSGYGIEKSFDGDKSTMYHSTWGTTNFPVTLTYYLTVPSDIDFFIYHTRTDGSSNGHFREFDVLVREAGASTFTKVLTKDLGGLAGAWKVYFDQTMLNIDAVRFVVLSGAGDGNGFAACAEMEFFKNKEGAFNPTTIFTDASCTTINTGITRNQLTAIDNPFYRQLALDIFDNVYTTEFRIQNYKAWPHPNDFSQNNRVGTYSLCDNPTGIFVRQGDTVIVFVEDIYDVPVSLTLKNYNNPDGNGYWWNTYYGLSKGANRIVADREGLFYVFYHSTAKHETVSPVKIHFAYGKVNGYYDAEKHTAADWTRILNNTQYEYFDALGKYTHLSFPTDKFKQNAATTGPQLIALYNNMSHMQREFMGYYKYPNRDPKNRDHLVVMYHSYMYATSYHTGYNIGTMDGLTNATNLELYPWGPAHEIGHINQHRPLLMWIGLTEVTTNIKSLLVQTNWGNTSRLTQENRYQNAFNEIMIEGKAQAEANIWHKLVAFWQLQLFFSNVLEQGDFYAKLYEAARTRPIGSSHGEHQLNFVKMVVDTSKVDLTEFFTAWNYLKPVDVMVEDYSTARLAITQSDSTATANYIQNTGFAALPYKIQYITDSNWQLYKNQAQVVEGSATRFGSTFKMTGWTNVVAYEAWQGTTLVGISLTDQIAFSGDYTENTKVYAIQYDGTRYEVIPDAPNCEETPCISDGTNEYWYHISFQRGTNLVLQANADNAILTAETKITGSNNQLWKLENASTVDIFYLVSKTGQKIYWDGSAARFRSGTTSTPTEIRALPTLNSNYPDSWELQRSGSTTAAMNPIGGSTAGRQIGEYFLGDGGNPVKFVLTLVTSKPVAEFSASATEINAGETITFSDISMNTPTSWEWTFPGGTPSSSTEQNPTVSYNTSGTYSVSLTATNNVGSNTITKTNYVTVNTVAVTYCNSASQTNNYGYILRIKMNDFVNTSSGSNYSDFTAQTIPLVPGQSVTYELTPNNNSQTQYWSVYIDYNQDGNFTLDERVINVQRKRAISGTYTVPLNALTGQTRMRIMMKYGGYPANACEMFTHGEVEDYTVNLIGNQQQIITSINSTYEDDVTIYPTANQIIVNLGETHSARILVYDVMGRQLTDQSIHSGENSINVMKSGIYIVKVYINDSAIYRKVIIQ